MSVNSCVWLAHHVYDRLGGLSDVECATLASDAKEGSL